jgi:type I restriction enzyme R subunit
MVNLSEKETRERYIDPILKDEGWKEEYIKKEVNSLASNFKKNRYECGFKEGEEGRFLDYLLVDEDGSPLAIIEAKRFSLEPEKGTIQAATYQKDIEAQIKIVVPVFLTNGKKWYLKEKDYPMREISGPFSQEDLHRRSDLSKKQRDLSQVEVNMNIVTRSKSIEVVKRVLDHFNSKRRSALINMATGTGKTRVAMALIEALIKSNCVRNVLFVVDRISLGRQAFGAGFKKFFASTPSCLLNEQEFTKDKRLYVSTVQTLMSKQKGGGNYFQKFGPAFFDLIIFDEAHRSYYDRQNLVMKYFDALNVGLTATPSKSEARDTYELFDCMRGEPTVAYSYDEAVRDGVLVPYDAQIVETKVLSLGIKGMDLNKQLQTELIKQDEDPEHFQVPGTRFAKYFTDEKTNELIISEFMNRCHKTEEGKPCKSIFFCVNVKHAEALKRMFDRLYPNLCNETAVIVSEYSRYMDEVARFDKDSSPRIAISVGVLDTGIDIPEVMNIVFVTPVISQIRFWQMLGRGTRSLSACRYKSWLPLYNEVHDKRDFRIIDFKFGDWSNVLVHQLEVADKAKLVEDIRIKIMKKELEVLKKKLTPKEKEIVSRHVADQITKIDQRSFIVRDKVSIIKKVISKVYELDEHIDEIKEELAPLLKFSEFGDGRIQTFVSNCVDLFRYVKESDKEGIAKVQDFIVEHLTNVWESSYEAVRKKDEQIRQALQEKFWQELTFEDIDMLIRELAPLMIYYEKEKKAIIRINAPDFVINTGNLKMQLKEDKKFDEFKASPLIKKMAKEGINWHELCKISEMLSKLNPIWTIENIQKNQDFILFLRNVLDLKDLPDPEQMIKDEFEKLILYGNGAYNAQQISFLRMLSSFFAINKHLEKKDFTIFPLSEERPLEKFSPHQLEAIIKQVEKIRLR